MSTQYHKTISSNPRNTLKINIGGFKDGVVRTEDLQLSLYAYNTSSGSPVFNKTLLYDDIADLYNYLHNISIIRDNTRKCTNKFIELDEEFSQILDLIDLNDFQLLRSILQKIKSSNKQTLLLDILTNVELNDLSATIKKTQYTNSLKILSKLLELESSNEFIKTVRDDKSLNEYHAGQPEKIFQNWIEKNL